MVTIIGLGFVGLTTGLGFASKGTKVYGVDTSAEKIDAIRGGRVPFYEPHLEEQLALLTGKKFFPTTDLHAALKDSKVVFLCVGTPSSEDGSADLSQIYGAIEGILANLDKSDFKVLVVKSTIPPSTTSERIRPFIEKRGFEVGVNVGLANNPEFLREGYAWDDFVNPDRVVIGAEDEHSRRLLEELYRPFGKPVFTVSYNTGEYIKYLSNTLLSTLISFANEQSMIAHSVGNIDIGKAFRILHQDKRWSGSPASMTSYVYPGCGFGGYCLPKDTAALESLAGQKGFTAGVLHNVLQVNRNIKTFHLDRIKSAAKKSDRIAILGLAFKPESDDVRDTPASYFIDDLLKSGYSDIAAYDPIANDVYRRMYGHEISYCNSLTEVLDGAGVAIIVTGWKEFVEKKDMLADKKVFDLRYVLSK